VIPITDAAVSVYERIERLLFDGAPEPVNGVLRPDLSRPGFGFAFKRADATRYAA
jgi:hypothetical protein